MNLPADEVEYLLHSEKRAWLIVYVYDAMLHVLKRPFIFRHYFDPVTDKKTFTAEFEEYGEEKELTVEFSVLDYSPHEIEGIVRLEYAKLGVSIPEETDG